MPSWKLRVLACATAVAALGASGTLAAPAVSATPDLSGRWVSDSLRDNRIGYYLLLRQAPGKASGYVGHLRFERQSGQRDARMRVTVTVMGDNVVITARAGRFDRTGRTLRARLGPNGTLSLVNCLDRLQQVMSWDLDSDCTLRLQS